MKRGKRNFCKIKEKPVKKRNKRKTMNIERTFPIPKHTDDASK